MRENKGKYAVLLERVNIAEKDKPWIDENRMGEIVWLHIDHLNMKEWEKQFVT